MTLYLICTTRIPNPNPHAGKPVEHFGGMLALADVLRESSTMKTLSLQQNCIGPMGVEFMVKALAGNTALVMLDLSANLLGPQGCAAFAPLWMPTEPEGVYNETLVKTSTLALTLTLALRLTLTREPRNPNP